MKRALPILAVLALPAPARAGEAACWLDNGVLVAPAKVAGEAGDYILDTGQARSQMHETRAQTAGLPADTVRGEVELGGLTLAPVAAEVADLDARTRRMPTPIAGVLGADALKGLVLDIRLSPCRVGLYRPGTEPPIRGLSPVPLHLSADGRPVTVAGVADGGRAWRAAFVLATGADAPLRLSAGAAQAPGAAEPGRLGPYGDRFARLRAFSLWDRLTEFPAAGLTPAVSLPDGAAGAVGPAAFRADRLRLDLASGRLLVGADTKKAPASPPGP